MIELETGVHDDGTLVARRAARCSTTAPTRRRAVLPADGGHDADGPYRIPNVDLDAHLAYTNLQPSGSVRAPAAPQMCWAVEQHTDAIAGRLGMDPVEFRRRNLVVEGDEGPDRAGVRDDRRCARRLEHALELIGYGKELPAGRGDRDRLRLVADVLRSPPART